MIYDKRNRATINELAPNTKAAALKWYDYCLRNKVEILIYEGRRTEAEQRANVKRGASQTMKSYHLVGQALDFVPVDSRGNALWSLSAYKSPKVYAAIQYAKSIGFEWGGDWKGFVDGPHLQFNYKGYGTDKVLVNSNPKPIEEVVKKEVIKEMSKHFKDVPKDHWASEFVDKGFERGIFKGDQHGMFNVNSPVTRGELAVVVERTIEAVLKELGK